LRNFSVLFLPLVVACGSHVGAVNINTLPAPQRAEIRAVQIYDSAQLSKLTFQVVDLVEGVSCKNKIWDKPASRSAALEQARYKAWELGANGLANLDFAAPEGTDYGKNCWESVTVSAEAIRVTGE
jgi:hypothetical protein